MTYRVFLIAILLSLIPDKGYSQGQFLDLPGTPNCFCGNFELVGVEEELLPIGSYASESNEDCEFIVRYRIVTYKCGDGPEQKFIDIGDIETSDANSECKDFLDNLGTAGIQKLIQEAVKTILANSDALIHLGNNPPFSDTIQVRTPSCYERVDHSSGPTSGRPEKLRKCGNTCCVTDFEMSYVNNYVILDEILSQSNPIPTCTPPVCTTICDAVGDIPTGTLADWNPKCEVECDDLVDVSYMEFEVSGTRTLHASFSYRDSKCSPNNYYYATINRFWITDPDSIPYNAFKIAAFEVMRYVAVQDSLVHGDTLRLQVSSCWRSTGGYFTPCNDECCTHQYVVQNIIPPPPPWLPQKRFVYVTTFPEPGCTSQVIGCHERCDNFIIESINSFKQTEQGAQSGMNIEQNLKIYPVPTDNVINIEFNATQKGKLNIKVHDLLGNELFNLNNNIELNQIKHQLNVSQYQNGTYNVSIYIDDLLVIHKSFVVLK